MSLFRWPFSRPVFFLFFLSCLPAGLLARPEWEPIDPADLRATDCSWYPGASAEVLLMRLVLVGSTSNESFAQNYRRTKIYSAKGVEDQGVLGIERSDTQRLWSPAARVTKPDGTSKEYGKESFHEEVEAKLGRTKIKRLVLAVPGLAAGDIIELKWNIAMTSASGWYYWWYSQLEIPVRRYTFRTENLQRDYMTTWFNVKADDSKSNKSEGLDLVMSNIPPFKEEPDMPPERDVRGWFMIFFRDVYLRWFKGDNLLKEIGTYYDDEFQRRTKPDSTVKAKAKALVQGATTDEEKLRRLYDFCQREVENFDYLDSAALQAAKKKLGDEQVQWSKETLTRRTGGTAHINDLFASLARGLGYEVLEGRAASRSSTLTVKNDNGWLFLQDQVVLVKAGGEWKIFAPGDYFVPAGMLDLSNAAVPVMICREDKLEWTATPMPVPQVSQVKRHGKFTVDAEGTLEGEAEIELTGYPAIERKRAAHGKQQEEIDTDFRTTLTEALPSAEVTDLAWENLTGAALPVKVRFKLKVPGYADAIGSKLVVPLDVFTHNRPAKFTSEERAFPIVLKYPASEHDELEIVMPEGFKPDAPSAPRDAGSMADIGASYRVGYQGSARTIKYRREFILGEGGAFSFMPASYAPLKKRFDAIKRSDEHTMVFAEVTPENPTAAPATPPANP